ncbi:MAG: GIY-YIG nuclease family protein [Chloroflexi bacterium]|nr:GIY-YIG nuclease family protein [Chloroflexota bacterium]
MLHVIPRQKDSACYINSEGRLFLPAPTLDSLKWKHGTAIALAYLADPLTLLLRDDADGNGFTLMRRAGPTNTQSPRGVVTCTGFTNGVLRSRVALPLRNIKPIVLKNATHKLALQLEAPTWTREEFSQAGRQNVPPGAKGVYQLLDANEQVLRIGEGAINSRIGQHLKNSEFISAVRYFRYYSLADKEEMQIFEQVLLANYEMSAGKLPVLNTLHG